MSPKSNIGRPLVYAHFSNLHITDAKARSYQDFLAMLVQLEVAGGNLLNFLYLLGDNGQLTQYRLVATATCQAKQESSRC